MSRRDRKQSGEGRISPPQSPSRGVDVVTVVTLGGLVAALLMAFASWQKVGFLERTLDDRLARIESQLSQTVDSAARAGTQPAETPRRGPDPNRVYDVRTAGAPVRGAADAPVTIAEFSDFQ